MAVTEGTNLLVGNQPRAIVDAVDRTLNGGVRAGSVPALWAGRAAQRIAAIVARELLGG